MTATAPKVAILNAYHCRNLGDRAIVECQMAWCRRILSADQVLVYSQAWQSNAGIFGNASKQALFATPLGAGALGGSLRGFQDMMLWLLKRGRRMAEFQSNDVFVLCGGGYLYSSHAPLMSRAMVSLCLQSLSAVSTGRPVIPFPQSFGPLKPGIDEIVVQRLCRKMPVLTPRDGLSMEWLKDRGFSEKSILIPDIVLAMPLLLPEYYPTKEHDRRDGLGIAAADYSFARHYDREESERYIQTLANAATEFHHRFGGVVRLFVQVSLPGSDDDRRIVDLLAGCILANGVPVEIIQPDDGLTAYLAAISKCKVFVGSRMHACIFSLTTATPTIGLAYQPKFQGLFNHMDLDDWVTDIETVDPSWLRDRLTSAAEGQGHLSDIIRGKVALLSSGILASMNTVARKAGALSLGNLRSQDH